MGFAKTCQSGLARKKPSFVIFQYTKSIQKMATCLRFGGYNSGKIDRILEKLEGDHPHCPLTLPTLLISV